MLFFNISGDDFRGRYKTVKIACVCLVNETQKSLEAGAYHLEANKMDDFSKYHNFIFELNGIRVWRADGVGKGLVIPYQDTIAKPQAPRSTRSCCICTLFFSKGGSNP